jgi:hypothetical protein
MTRLFAWIQLTLVAVGAAACGNMTSPISPTALSSPTTAAGSTGIGGGASRTAALAEGWSAQEIAVASSISSSNEALLRMAAIEHQNGDLAAVKAFAFQVVQDLTAAQNQLQEKGGGSLPSPSLNDRDARAVRELEGLTGGGLDRAFVSAVLQVLTSGSLSSHGVPPGPSTLATDVEESKARAARYYFMVRDLAGLVDVQVSDPGTSGNGSGGVAGSGSGAIFFAGN